MRGFSIRSAFSRNGKSMIARVRWHRHRMVSGVIRGDAGSASPRWRLHAILLAVLIVGTAGSQLLADGVIRDGLGARSIGRGGTNLGYGDNAAVLLDNPAGIGNISSNGLLDMSGDLLLTDLTYADPDNPTTSAANNPFPVGEFAVVRRIPNSYFTAGFGFVSHAGFAAQYDLNGPSPLVGVRNYKSIGVLARVLPSLACQLTDRLVVGTSIGLAISHVELEGPYFLQGPNPFRGTPLMLDLQSTGIAPSISAGLQYSLTPETIAGVSYTEEASFALDGNTLVDIPGLGAARYDSTLHTVWPRFLGAGIKHTLARGCTIALDAIWYDWSKAFDVMTLELRNPDNPLIASVTGPYLVECLPFDWRDTVSIRTGYEQRLGVKDTLRAGYVYHRNPIPASTQNAFVQTILEHAVSFGYTRHLGQIDLDFAYQYSFGPDVHVGQSELIGGDFSNSMVQTEAHWLALGLQRRW
jgi:long-chain fatty acid transport protein